MSSLKMLQVLSKIAWVFSKIVRILCIIGLCGCFVGIAVLTVGAHTVKVGGVTFYSLIKNSSGFGMESLYAVMVAGMILCLGEAILAQYAEHYFRRELQDGTPFTQEGAKELQRLGIRTICVSIGSAILAQIAQAAVTALLHGGEELTLEGGASVGLGVVFLILSVVFRYGAELNSDEVNSAL